MSAARSFQVIGFSCLQHLLANEPVLRETRDPEAVHQMRVAVRRLRAAISIFKAMAADERGDAVRRDLRWLATQLGEARDLDASSRRRSRRPANGVRTPRISPLSPPPTRSAGRPPMRRRARP